MAAMDEIEVIVRHIAHKLSVAILPVPSSHTIDSTEKLPIERQRIRLAPDVDAVPDEVSPCEIGVGEPPSDGFAAFFHVIYGNQAALSQPEFFEA
jgi:hypothetical protein